ncbi:hypothetical protein K505DRAFT_326978 [Melanomma pulvis-pyrius CBS 109.77]|uniref:Uncharacterized protein n=1 Tax=Melanomma pulvis-pyrius CBS 109.77 TaxID=1314802 RepID=A0A6A6X4S2_9PLEO|nr:hypothetical protein K505DRAFT_326978 [Melanomma pulvis-pyrius CBS 109.77]
MSSPTPIFSSSFLFSKEDCESKASSSWPPQPKRKTSSAHNAAMREIIKSWASVPSTPPECQTISSSWSKFSSSSVNSKSKEDLLASVLWVSNGTSPDYSPPPSEWTYLGVEQPVAARNPIPNRNRRPARLRRQPASTSSWSTASSVADGEMGSEPITFRKVAVRGVSTSSLLTESLRRAPGAGLQNPTTPLEVLAKEMKTTALSASMLPSAFDSDTEDEDDE